MTLKSQAVIKHGSIPGFLSDYNSFQNPFLEAFLKNISFNPDKNQPLTRRLAVGLGHQRNRKMIDTAVLKRYGGKEVHLKKDESIFRQEEAAMNYYQIAKGSVKLVTNTPDGKEFIQGIFGINDSFGEPPLFCSFPYPSSAMALTATTIVKVPKDQFFKLLSENFEIHIHLDKVLCERLKYKSMVLSEISSYDPEHRITSILRYLKEESNLRSQPKLKKNKADNEFIVPFTRQQLADMSGLRVETVIRTVKKMEDQGKLRVVSRKIAF